MASPESSNSYDDVPYQGGTVVGTHPEHLAVLGTLFGMKPRDVTSCRVLEIGCALGANLLPMAYSLPDSEFVGIDASARQIEMGRQMAKEYGVTNLKLMAEDVQDISSWKNEEFDYIICHGVLTWVPPEVQNAIFAACRALLAPQGIAYISYNALPGFHLRAGIGEMMRYHARHFEGAEERVEQASALLNFLVETTGKFASTGQISTYHDVLDHEATLLRATPSYYLMHEHLVDDPSAFYLHEFLEMAAPHRLQYLGDASFHTMMLRDLPDDVAKAVNSIAGSQIALEQYRDFVVNRTFRRSLVCRDDVELQRHISAEAIRACSFRARLAKELDGPWTIQKVGGFTAVVNDEAVVTVLDVLDAALPRPLSFEELLSEVGAVKPVEEEHLCAILLSLFSLDAVSFRTWSPPVASVLAQQPIAFWPARRLAEAGDSHIPNVFHDSTPEEPFIRRLVALLDGTRSTDQLADAMKTLIDNGEVTFDDQPEESPSREEVLRLVNGSLGQILRAGVLVS